VAKRPKEWDLRLRLGALSANYESGLKFQRVPLLLFRRYRLEQMRQKRFTDRQLLTSNELNVLNLVKPLAFHTYKNIPNV